MESIDKNIDGRQNKKPHLYVLYTMSGQEHRIIQMLQTSIMKPIDTPRTDDIVLYSTDEYAFCPSAIYQMKLQGKLQPVERRLFPGYVFITTPKPLDFSMRVREFRIFFRKYLQLLTTDFSDDEDFAIKIRSNESYKEWMERYFKNYVAELKPYEEQMVLAICGLQRDESGNIIKRADQISQDEIGELLSVGVTMEDMFGPDTYSDSPFKPAMSYGVDVNKHVVVTSGALVGMDGVISSINRHKRTCKVNINLLGREVSVLMPLTVIKKIEV